MYPYYHAAADDGWDGDWDELPVDPGSFYAPIQPWDLMEPMEPFPPWEDEDWEFEGLPVEIVVDMLLVVVEDFALTEHHKKNRVLEGVRRHTAWDGEAWVGWSQPPRPADVVVSFDPRASKKDQARAVLYDYYHDDPLRYWSDNEAVKRCFGVKTKEDHDPLQLIAAYENKSHHVWKCRGTGMTWADMNKAVQQAIAHRMKLGSLPRSTYDKYPLVIYYYDNDKMKRITYPGQSIPPALNPSNSRWWAWGMGDQSDTGKAAGLDDVHTRETDDPKKIQVEREHPGWTTKVEKQALKQKYSWISDMDSGSAGDWSSEGATWDKDVAGTGVIGSITGAILALVSAILDATGVGAVIGVPLGIATPFVVAAINATDTALHSGDFGAALTNLGPALLQASVSAASKGMGAAGIQLPPAATQALGGTVTAIGKAVAAGQQKKLDFGQIWQDVAEKAKGYSRIGDEEAEAIASMLAGPKGQAGGAPGTAGHVFIQGYLAGKFLDAAAIAGIAKILQAYAAFADPRIINVALLGMGIGYVSKKQGGSARPVSAARAPHATRGTFEIEIGLHREPVADLMSFVYGVLAPRYGLRGEGFEHVAGLSCPEGYDVVSSDHGIACAYRRRASCLGGHMDEAGRFVCTQHDYPECPRGTVSLPGKPENWCFPVGPVLSGAGYFVGDAPPSPVPSPDFGPLSRGCPVGSWWDPLQQICRPIEPGPPPLLPHR
jgi:hypothetical protein